MAGAEGPGETGATAGGGAAWASCARGAALVLASCRMGLSTTPGGSLPPIWCAGTFAAVAGGEGRPSTGGRVAVAPGAPSTALLTGARME
ncbi:MAG: hypothetical protein AUJ49_13785 [Desulfovibrionaceae bacterium CG1_02_65_16]|nr:MAG: hypothetical protein AUJ49_13785 [Desulfovibrionaceae bacterium CG1_02_65_16]